MTSDKLRSLYIDLPIWRPPVKMDDFLVAIGERQSNSVYHVESVKYVERPKRMIRYYMKVFKSDLITAFKRESTQALITLYWCPRKKKGNT